MEGIHHERTDTRCPGQKAATRHQLQRMRRAVLHLQWGVGVLTMVQQTWDRLHLLVQAATQRHIQLLKATADTQNRDIAGNGQPQQWQRGGIPVCVVQRTWRARRTGIMVWLYVGWAASKQQAVDRGEYRLEVEFLPEHRDKEGRNAASLVHRPEVLLTNTVEGVMTEPPTVRRDADYRRAHV